MSELIRTALAVEKPLLERFDAWMDAHGYTNRSEAMRDLMRKTLTDSAWQEGASDLVAVLSIVYDHHARDLAQEVTSLQHAQHEMILCSQHVHLSHHNCLETIIMKGPAAELRKLADQITTTKGIRAGNISVLSDAF